MGYYDRDPAKITWPGLEGDKSGTEINRTKMKNAIDDLRKDLEKYGKTVNGTAKDVQDRGLPSMAAVGAGPTNQDGYPAGRVVYDSMRTSHQALSEAYQQFMTAYGNVINALEQTVSNSSKADQGSAVNGNSPGQSGTGYYGGQT